MVIMMLWIEHKCEKSIFTYSFHHFYTCTYPLLRRWDSLPRVNTVLTLLVMSVHDMFSRDVLIPSNVQWSRPHDKVVWMAQPMTSHSIWQLVFFRQQSRPNFLGPSHLMGVSTIYIQERRQTLTNLLPFLIYLFFAFVTQRVIYLYNIANLTVI